MKAVIVGMPPVGANSALEHAALIAAHSMEMPLVVVEPHKEEELILKEPKLAEKAMADLQLCDFSHETRKERRKRQRGKKKRFKY